MIYYIVFVLSTEINNIVSTEENNLFSYDNTSFSSDREQGMASTNKKFTSRDNRPSPYKRSNDVTQLQKNDNECNLLLESINIDDLIGNASFLETSADSNNQSNVEIEWDIDGIITQLDFVIERKKNNLFSYDNTSFSSDREQRMASNNKKFTSRENRLSPYKRSNDVTQLQKNDEECNLSLVSTEENNFVGIDSFLETSADSNDQSNIEIDHVIYAIITQSILTIEQEKEITFCWLKSELKEYTANDNSFSSDKINDYINSVKLDKRNQKNFSHFRTYIENYNKDIKVTAEIYIQFFLDFLETHNIDLHTKNYVRDRLLFLQNGLKYLYKFFYDEKVTMLNKDSILKTYVQLYIEIEKYFKKFNFKNILPEIICKIYPKEGNKKFYLDMELEIQILEKQINKIFRKFNYYIGNLRRSIECLKFKKQIKYNKKLI